MLHPKLTKLDLSVIAPAGAPAVDGAPACAAQLEEAAAAAPGDWGAAFAFSLARLCGRPDPRPLALILTRFWMGERGRPCARGLETGLGLAPGRLLMVEVEREAQGLWAMEEALKSGALAGALAAVDAVPFVVSRRLEFAARAGDAVAVILRARPSPELSAARLRWQVSSLPSAPDRLDPNAPGAPRWRAELTRRRDGVPGAFTAEWEEGDETPRLRLAQRLAGDGVVEGGRTRAAA